MSDKFSLDAAGMQQSIRETFRDFVFPQLWKQIMYIALAFFHVSFHVSIVSHYVRVHYKEKFIIIQWITYLSNLCIRCPFDYAKNVRRYISCVWTYKMYDALRVKRVGNGIRLLSLNGSVIFCTTRLIRLLHIIVNK